MLTPKFGKLTLERKVSTDDIKDMKIIFASQPQVQLSWVIYDVLWVDKGYLIFQILGKETQSSLINLLQRSYVDKSKRSIIADLDIYMWGKVGKEIGRWLLASKRSYMHAGLISPREIVNLILQANRERNQGIYTYTDIQVHINDEKQGCVSCICIYEAG